MDMQLVAWVAAALVFASFFMKTMIPLRMLAIGSNIAFIAYAVMGLQYGLMDKVLPILILHIALLILNTQRLRQVKATIRQVRAVRTGELSLEFLIPYMDRETARQGDVLFRKGDKADRIYLLQCGRVELVEVGKSLVAGDVFGEVGVFADHECRLATALCQEDCELFSITGDKVVELFYQDPRFGFFIVRTLSQYVTENSIADAPRDSGLAIPAGATFELAEATGANRA